MTSNILYAYLHRNLVGRFIRQSNGNVSFIYDDDYRWSQSPTPLSLSLPLEEGRFDDERPLRFLEALVPEAPAARENAARLHQAASTSAFDLLMSIGLDSTGALRLSANPQLPDDDNVITPITDREIAQRLREAAPAGDQPAGENEHWSVAGQQGKTALLNKGGQWFTASGTARTTHILKPGIPGLADQAFDEHFTMRIAHYLDLHVADTTFQLFNGEPAIVIKRFDRHEDDAGNIISLHQIDFTQALGTSTDRKYEEHGGPLSESYANMLREHDIYHEAEDNIRGFADGMLVSYLLGATDSHAKNYSLILEGAHVQLAPLYDLASVFPYLTSNTHHYSTTLAMTIGGQRKLLQLRPKHLRRFAQRMQLDEEAVMARFIELLKNMPGAFDQAVEENRKSLPLLRNNHFIDDYRRGIDKTYTDGMSWIGRS